MSGGEEEEGPRLVDGRVIRLTVQVQCFECASVFSESFEWSGDPDDVVAEDIGCPTCTHKAGEPVCVPVAVLAGDQVAEHLEPLGDGEDE